MLGKNFNNDILKYIYIFFPENRIRFFNAKWLPRGQFAWNVESYFLGENKKKEKKILICRMWNLPEAC